MAEELRAELARLLQTETRDPRLAFVTVLDVRMSADLRHARVFLTSRTGSGAPEDVLKAAGKASGFLRRELGRRLALRHTPDLTFLLDDAGPLPVRPE